LAVSGFDIPGDSGFPLNEFYAKPSGRGEQGMREFWPPLIQPSCQILSFTDKSKISYISIKKSQIREHPVSLIYIIFTVLKNVNSFFLCYHATLVPAKYELKNW